MVFFTSTGLFFLSNKMYLVYLLYHCYFYIVNMRASFLFFFLFDITYFFMCLFGGLALVVIVIFIIVYFYYLFTEVGLSRFLSNLKKKITNN